MSLPQFRSSGNLTADRRYDYAVALLKEGEAVAAADLLEQALELEPTWIVGLFTLGEARLAAGDRDGAITAWRAVTRLDPNDHLGASLHLARLGAAVTPRTTATAYVRDLFDDYAGRFDHALVVGLGYQAPKLIARALRETTGARPFKRCLDLGCGTGLMAAELSGIGAIDGIDLSAGMIDQARAKGLYRSLEVAEAHDAMRSREADSYDLVTAADVFCYFGDLVPAFGEVARLLSPGGVFAFSVETLTDAVCTADFQLADSLRFRHDRHYVERSIVEAGLSALRCDGETLRLDRGHPVTGLILVAQKREDVTI